MHECTESLASKRVREENLPLSLKMRIQNPGYKQLTDPGNFESFSSFYPFYLGQHANKICRRLHIAGTSLVVFLALAALYLQKLFPFIYLIPTAGYGFAWIGHFFFEKNRPATFKYPIYSLLGDFKLWFEVVSLQRPF